MSDVEEDNIETPKFCPQCGTPVKRPNARFCTQCGKNFVGDSTGEIQPLLPPISTPASGSSSVIPTQDTPPLYSDALRQPQSPQRSGEMITPNEIRPVSGSLFTRAEFKHIGIFALVAYLSHFFRFLLLFDRFPAWQDLIFPIPMYLVSVPLIFTIQKWFMRDKGVQMDIIANDFDYTRSLVFSTFFLTLLPPRFKINTELSKVPEKITLREASPQGLVYREVTIARYVGSVIRPRMHFLSGLVITLFSMLFLYLYINAPTEFLSTSYRLVTLYIVGFQLVELAPIFGRNNDKSADHAKIRTLLLFIIVLAVFTMALLGENFYLALQERF